MGAYVEPTKNMGTVQTEQHVITLATEAALDAQESLDGIYASGADLDDLKVRPCPLTTAPRLDRRDSLLAH